MASEASLPAGIEYKSASIYTCTYCEKEIGRKNIDDHVKGKKHEKRKKLHEERASQPINVDDEVPADGQHASMMDVQVDKDALLNSILNGPSEDEEEDAGDASDMEMAHDIDVSAARINTAFAPLEFKPADGIDNFFDSMPEEAARTEVSKDIRTLLESSTPKKKVVPLDKSTPTKMSLTVNREDGKDTARKSGAIPDDPNAMPTWVIGADSADAVRYSSNANLALHYEILEFERYQSPTDEERATREKLAASVKNIVKTLWPACRIETFGSYATGLYLPSSDIDVCVLNSPRNGSEDEMEELAAVVRRVKGFARQVKVIRAKVGLVKIVSQDGKIQCDISFGKTDGPRNVPIILNYIKDYPALRPLLLVIKHFLQQRSLNEVYYGGIGSYTVLLLVVSHLQMLKHNFPGIQTNLGDVLKHFFLLYGRKFNYCVAGIQVAAGMYYNKVQRYDTKPGETLRFSIEDPNDVDNEIGNNSFAAGRVRKAFGNAYLLLHKWDRNDSSHPISPLSQIIQSDEKFRNRRPAVLEYLQKEGTTEMRKYIEKHRKIPPRQERIPDRIGTPHGHGHGGVQNGNGYHHGQVYHHGNGHGNAHNNNRDYYDGQKRRRTNNNSSSRNYQSNNNHRNYDDSVVFAARYQGPQTNRALVYNGNDARPMQPSMAARMGNTNRNHNRNRNQNRRGSGGHHRN